MMNLAVHSFCRILLLMNRWPSRRAFALVLGVLLALGMTVSAVQAGGMVVKMVSMASTMGATGQGGCDGCGSDDGKAAAAGACLSVCTTQALAVLPPTFSVSLVPAKDLSLPRHATPPDRTSSPDPDPPRPADLV